MVKKIQIVSCKNGSVIYEHVCECNTVQKTLEHAFQHGIGLEGAYLSELHFESLFLRFADFKDITFEGVTFNKCYLEGADFRLCDFHKVVFTGCYLRHADFRNLDLSKTAFFDCFLLKADFRGTFGTHDIPMACPTQGAFIGWKKVVDYSSSTGYEAYLVELLIPEDAKRSSATSEKCRCSHAKVLSITNLKTNQQVNQVTNYTYEQSTKYVVGEYVYPDSFDTDRWHECTHGIHFFIDKELAINY